MSKAKRYVALHRNGREALIVAWEYREADESDKHLPKWIKESDYASLQAENERLRKAGNAMYDAAVQDSMGLWVMPAFEQWSKIKNETK